VSPGVPDEPGLLDALAGEGYDQPMARPARRANRVLWNPLSLALPPEELTQDETVAVVVSYDGLTFSGTCSKARKAADPKGAA
jgi:hypothetical protein